MTTGKVDYGTRRYAYGFTEETVNGHRLIGHGGGNTGIADELMIFPDLGYTVVILTNGDVENFWDIQAFVKRAILGSSPETEGYYFTRNLIDTAVSRGFQGGIDMLNATSRHPAIRNGLLEQWATNYCGSGKPTRPSQSSGCLQHPARKLPMPTSVLVRPASKRATHPARLMPIGSIFDWNPMMKP
jgi:hypothetical protein